MSNGLRILCAAKLHPYQLERHLELLERLPEVAEVCVVRQEPIPERLSKITNSSFGTSSLPIDLWRMFDRVASCLARRRYDWVLGFNPVPWGSVALAAARRHGTKVCLSVIGRDYLQLGKPWAAPFLRAVRLADAVTVPGASMLEGLVQMGVRRERLFILPHSVDLERFSPGSAAPTHDVISTGQLIRRKRMDLLVEATGRVVESGYPLKVGILGRGPLKAQLVRQVREAGLTDHVTFLEYRNDVETVLQSGRIFTLMSEWEGVPFALMEAMATGLVPVVTPVGSITDWVEHERNGLLVPTGDAAALARSLRQLLVESPERLARLRATLLAERSRLDLSAGEDVWRGILLPSSISQMPAS